MKFYCTIVLLLYGWICLTTGDTIKRNANPKIAILGAGMAGATLAKQLQELGYSNIIILEGGNRVGGRMKSIQVGNYNLQSGANWIQSLGSNPVLKLADQYNLSYIEADYTDYTAYNKNGKDITGKSKKIDDKVSIALDDVAILAEEMEMNNEHDATYRAGAIRQSWNPESHIEDLLEFFRHDFEFAFPLEANSLKSSLFKTYAIHRDGDDANVIDSRGFAHIPISMLHDVKENGGVEVLLNNRVSKIEQTDQEVIITTTDNTTFQADYAIVTFSIGVLQKRLVEFVPQLPTWKLDAIDQIEFSVYYNMFFQFPNKFWDDTQFILYAGDRRGYYPIFQNFNKFIPDANILHVTVIGDEARRVHRLSPNVVIKEITNILNKIYKERNGGDIPQPIDYYIPDWFSDPLFMGTYSNVPPGYTRERHLNLSEPIGRVYFAGEANIPEHFGYVQGAWYSAMYTANRLHDFISTN